MADKPIVHIGENSPEKVAYTLLHEVARVEGVSFHQNPSHGDTVATRKWILDTYGECLLAVRGFRDFD